MKEERRNCISRLVARGFEEIEDEIKEKDAPTCSEKALKIVLLITGRYWWKYKSIDVRTASHKGGGNEKEQCI